MAKKGRPPKPGETRSERISVLITPSELGSLDEARELREQTRSDFMRAAFLRALQETLADIYYTRGEAKSDG